MVVTLNATPGQTITLSIQVLDGYGSRNDGYAAPEIDFVLTPALSYASGYPISMSRIDTGVFIRQMTFGQSSSVIGTYIISCSWLHPTTGYTQYELFMINVGLPFGNSTVFPM